MLTEGILMTKGSGSEKNGIEPGSVRDRFESLVQSIDGIVWEAEAETFKFTFVNQQAERILGYPVESWLNVQNFWVDHIHPVDREWAVGFCTNATQRKQDHQFEYRMIAADGRIVWLRDIVTVNVADNGTVVLRGVMVDTTERVEAMNELLASETRLHMLLEQIPAIVWSTDTDLRFTQMAGSALSLLRVPEERNNGVSLYDYFQTQDPGYTPIAAHQRALAGESLSFELDWMGYVFDAYVEPLRNAVGEVVGCVGIATDITRRKRAEETILKEKRLTEAMFESLPGIFYLYNRNGKYLRWNKNFERATGYSADEIAEMHPLDKIADDEKAAAITRIEEVFATGQSTLEADLVAKDGGRTPYFFTGQRVTIDDQECLIGMGIDITVRKSAEDENRKLIHLLGERVKELTILHEVAGILQIDGKSVPQLLEEIVALIPPAWQYPEITAARISFGDYRFETDSFVQNDWLQKAEFEVAGEKGAIEVVYLERRPGEDEGPFLVEERRLIDSLSEMISSALDRLCAQEELRESQRRFSDTLTNLEMIAVMVDTSGTISFCNDYLLRITGWEREEVIGQNWFEMFLPDHEREKVEKILPKVDSEESIIAHFENEIKTRSDERRLVKWTNTTLRDLNGKVTGVAALGNDITEREHFEQELRKSEERYRDLVENARDIIYTHDLAGNYTSINKAGEQITGYTRDDVLTMNLAQIVAPEYLERSREMMTAKLAGEEETIYDLEIVAKDGRRIAIEVNTRLVFRGDVPVGIQGIARDVTERKHLAEQLRQAQKMEAVGRLAGGIAHDFNNMLTVITGYSDLILRKLGADDPMRSQVEEIRKAGESSASLTHQLLAFSRKQLLQPKVLDLNSVILNLKKMLRRLIGEDVVLTTSLAPDLGSIEADPGQIEQVLMNLAVNARDAMPRGGKLIIRTQNIFLDKEYITHHVMAKQGFYVMLTVSDFGIGISAEDMDRVFEPFYTTKEVGMGTGLGLATVYGIIKQSEGYITVLSELGHGTTFSIYLPLVGEGPEEYKQSSVSERSLRGTETILLIEDEEIVRNLTRELLVGYGYNVLEAAGGEEGLAVCKQQDETIHLLITDVIMPGMSGPELADKLMALHSEMKLLYISGYTDDTIVHHGILDSDINFLQKPFKPEGLARKVREVLDKK
jgi:two-component system, cell cycle sensor histidine kinase and response regulator CckA